MHSVKKGGKKPFPSIVGAAGAIMKSVSVQIITSAHLLYLSSFLCLCFSCVTLWGIVICVPLSLSQGAHINRASPTWSPYMSVPLSDTLFHYVSGLVPSLFPLCFVQVWFQCLHRWVPSDTIARTFPITEQPSLNPRACRVSSHTTQILFKFKGHYSLSLWNWYSDLDFDYFTWSLRLDLLSPTSAFRFPMPGGDGQSLQRHRSTSTPNVHMVSTVGPAGASIIEVSASCLVNVLIGCYCYEDPIVSTVCGHLPV